MSRVWKGGKAIPAPFLPCPRGASSPFHAPVSHSHIDGVLEAGKSLADELDRLSFSPPVHLTYNVFRFARAGHEAYVRRFCNRETKVLFLGMNPGPWGMTQTGVPFGEVAAVRDWMGLRVAIDKPAIEHPKRPVQGFDCPRSEVSGRRLWGLFAERFGTPNAFFAKHFVSNFCPLVFMEEGGKNVTPDKLRASEAEPVERACDAYLARLVELLEPEWVVGVGKYALKQAERALAGADVAFASILHPSPASPAANKGWAEAAEKTLLDLGIWPAAKRPDKG